MPIELNIIKEQLLKTQSVEEKADIYTRLTEAGLNPRDYRAADHDYVPFLLQIAIDGELRNFLDIVKDHFDLVASVFRVLHPSYIADLASKHKTAYGIQQAKIETKLIAIGYIARNTSGEEQDAMIAAFQKYDDSRAQAVNVEKQKQLRLIG